MKIRGNAHHVAEKYLQLARDAHTSGDPVAAENYLQHAEHYFRLIASAQAAQLQAQNGGRPAGEADYDDDDDDDDVNVLTDRFASPSERAQQMSYSPAQPYAPQPQFVPQPNVQPPTTGYVLSERQPFEPERVQPQPQPQPQPQQQPQPQLPERPNFAPRQDRQPSRAPNRERNFGDRQEGFRENRGERNRDFRPYRENVTPRPEPQPTIEAPGALPPFITGAPRIAPIPEEPDPQPFIAPEAPQPVAVVEVAPAPQPAPVEAPEPPAAPDAAADARFPRGRRRRLRSPYGFNAAGHPDEGQPPLVAPEETPASD